MKSPSARRARRRRRIVGVVLFFAIWVGAAFALDAYGRRKVAKGQRFDAIVVLGCRVYANGKPSAALARRTRLAVKLYEAGLAPQLVFTGGVGSQGGSEARAAANLAQTLGVSPAHIVMEERSTSTEENARFAREMIDAQRVLVVSDAYHVLRGELVFSRYFSEVRGVGSLNEPYPRVRGSLREVLALAGYALTGRLSR